MNLWSTENDCIHSTRHTWALEDIIEKLDQWRFSQILRHRRNWLGLLIKIVFFAGTYSKQRWRSHSREALVALLDELYPKQWVSIYQTMWTCTSQASKIMGNLGLTWQRKPFLLLRTAHGTAFEYNAGCVLGSDIASHPSATCFQPQFYI